MIRESVAFLKAAGKEVIFDGEHFFDGYKANPAYALACLEAAAGADLIALCDTNGGGFPMEIYGATQAAARQVPTPLAIHCHDDCGMAVANSILAVEAGAVSVQGTFLGFGERCGNANLSAIIPNLQLKKNIPCIPPAQLQNLTGTARFIAEVANVSLKGGAPYVGRSAFSHKAGMHIDGVAKASRSFEHVAPEAVGNSRKFLTSEVAGRSSLLAKIRRVAPEADKGSPEVQRVLARLKAMEQEGYQFEGAESTFELLIRKQLGKYRPLFRLEHFKVIGEQPARDACGASALIKIIVDGKTEITAAEGDGPVHALDRALRKALEVFYPQLGEVRLTDYKVRVLDSQSATASKVRVLIESADGTGAWTTVGVSTDILQASWMALVDSIEYKLIRDLEKEGRT
jgi:2-isopropylmalate synthase